ncbi:hypothetical protein X777_08460 [Ooceraea biroi]|uniref:Uncharacterized protein n=1 Tax=Ooceraea biroi TaxID=2015173 RepID=A0A026WZJ1_OOCBI|nr:hypothetical protein X777_08460 [Ooceraea biroi]
MKDRSEDIWPKDINSTTIYVDVYTSDMDLLLQNAKMTSLIQRDYGSQRKRESTGSTTSNYLLLLNSLATDLDCMLNELCTTPDSYER